MPQLLAYCSVSKLELLECHWKTKLGASDDLPTKGPVNHSPPKSLFLGRSCLSAIARASGEQLLLHLVVMKSHFITLLIYRE